MLPFLLVNKPINSCIYSDDTLYYISHIPSLYITVHTKFYYEKTSIHITTVQTHLHRHNPTFC